MKKHFAFSLHPVHTFFGIAFVVYIIVGLIFYKDYGVSIDEYSQIDLGRVNIERIAQGSMEIQRHYDRYYGPAFEVPLYLWSHALQSQFHIPEIEGRHLGVFLFFASSVLVWYILIGNIFSSPFFGLVGSMLLVLYPRFFAEEFYNTKDMAFVALSIWILFALWQTLRQKRFSLFFLSFIVGSAIAVRAQGLLFLAVLCFPLAMTGVSVKQKVGSLIAFITVSFAAAFSMFPVFWNNTWVNLIGFWNSSANSKGVPTWYFGSSLISPDLPWHHLFVWVGISSFLSVLIFSCIGFFMILRHVLKKHNSYSIFMMTCSGIIVGTLLTAVFFHPRSYDGWRHVYYLYPCMIVLALVSLRESIERSKKRLYKIISWCILLLFLLDILSSFFFIWINHPNEYVYFNPLVGGYVNAKRNFDFDYWGISQRQLLGYLESLPERSSHAVWFDQKLPYTEYVVIPELRKRGMVTVDSMEKADMYIFINRDYRYQPPTGSKKLYAVTVGGADLSAIYAKPGK